MFLAFSMNNMNNNHAFPNNERQQINLSLTNLQLIFLCALRIHLFLSGCSL